jgi:hypothetical protein
MRMVPKVSHYNIYFKLDPLLSPERNKPDVV